MDITQVDHQVFQNIINQPLTAFHSACFNEAHKGLCDHLYYFLFKDKKYRLGLIAGQKKDTLYSPFSAPYGGFSFLTDTVRLEHIESAIEALINWSRRSLLKKVCITLPPQFYSPSFIAKVTNSFHIQGFSVKYIDLNYAYDLSLFSDRYSEHISHNARRNLKIALDRPLELYKCENDDDKQKAYKIIKENRMIKSFPLKLSWEQLQLSSSIIDTDYFMVNYSDEEFISAAIVFRVSSNTAQLIYWGDRLEYRHHKTMNFLSYHLLSYYYKQGYRYLDIGPSTDKSIPNYGLSEFKESIGCFVTPKITMTYEI